MSTGKIIAKTAAITAAAFIGVLLIVAIVLSVCCPVVLSDVGDSLGIPFAAIGYLERSYMNTQDINELGELVERCIKYEKHKKTVRYGETLVGHRYFADFCAHQDSVLASVTDGSYRVYITGNYVDALYETGRREYALTFAWGEILKQREKGIYYAKQNTMRYLVSAFSSNGERDGISSQLIGYLEGDLLPQLTAVYSGDATKKEQLSALYVDLYEIYRALFNEQKMQEYQSLYDSLG